MAYGNIRIQKRKEYTKMKKILIPLISILCTLIIVIAAWFFGLFDVIKASTRKIDSELYKEVYNRYTYNINPDTDYFPLFPREEGKAYTGFAMDGNSDWYASVNAPKQKIQTVKENTRDFKKVKLADNAYLLTDGSKKIEMNGEEYKNGVWVSGYLVINDTPFLFTVICYTDSGDQAEAFDFICKTVSDVTK